jgi:hypothetical protein
MKKTLFFVIGAAFTASLFLWGGCKLNGPSGPNYTEYSIQVDSIQHPDTISLGQQLPIKFYGKIGPSTCYSFSRFVGGVNNHDINIAVYGRYQSGLSNCVDSVQYLDGRQLSVNLITSGPFIIHIYQPSPPDLYDTIYVAPAASKPAR